MKTITKLATATLLALSVVAPALAADPEALTLAERDTYVSHAVAQQARHAGVEAYAYAPVHSTVGGVDLSIASQR